MICHGWGAKDCLALNEGDSIARKEVVPGLLGLLLYICVWQLHALTKLEVMILPGEASICLLS